jgi:hypothetical protein
LRYVCVTAIYQTAVYVTAILAAIVDTVDAMSVPTLWIAIVFGVFGSMYYCYCYVSITSAVCSGQRCCSVGVNDLVLL